MNNSISTKKLLITQQEMILIKNSEEIKNVDIYGNLYDCLERYPKLSMQELVNDRVFDDKAKVVLLNQANKKDMMTKIMQEWYAVKEYDIVDTNLNCQLCGKKNKYIFYIHNKLNETELHIGSDCVKKFPDIIGIKLEQRKLSKQRADSMRQKRKIEFEVMEGDELSFLDDVEKQYRNYRVILPYDLNEKLKETLYQLNSIKTSYIKNGGVLEVIFENYNVLKTQMIQLLDKATRHQEKIQNNILACNKDTAEWLLSNNPRIWEKVARNDGLFTEETLKSVWYPKYVESVLGIIRKHMADDELRLLRVNGNEIIFSVKNERYYYPVTFSMDIKTFMVKIGSLCLANKKYIFTKKELKNIRIIFSKRNYEVVYNSILSILKKHGYDFIIEDKTEQAYWKKMPYSEQRNKWSNRVTTIGAMYKKSNIETLLNTISPYLLENESVLDENFAQVIKKMESGKAWLTQEEKNQSEQIARHAKGMQKQKEFIMYK